MWPLNTKGKKVFPVRKQAWVMMLQTHELWLLAGGVHIKESGWYLLNNVWACAPCTLGLSEFLTNCLRNADDQWKGPLNPNIMTSPLTDCCSRSVPPGSPIMTKSFSFWRYSPRNGIWECSFYVEPLFPSVVLGAQRDSCIAPRSQFCSL